MIRRIVTWSADHYWATLTAWLLLIAVGGVFATQVRFDALPDLTNNQVQVLTRAPGLTPVEVEQHITRSIESSLGGIPGLVEHRSISRYGLSAVTAIFDDDVDPYRARQLVSERVSSLGESLPDQAEAPELGPLSGGLGEIYQFALYSEQRSPAELLEMVRFRLQPILGAIPGVVEVNTWGGAVRSLEVVADPAALARNGLDIGRFRELVAESTGRAAGAAIPDGRSQTLLRGTSQPIDAVELAMATLASVGEEPLRIGDLARVVDGERPRIGAATADGSGEVVFVMLQMLRGENARDVSKRIHEAMPLVYRALPEDVTLQVVYDRSTLVDGTLDTVKGNLLEGGLLVMVILFLLLGSVRAGILVALAIPVSMLGAATAMVIFDIPGNLMSLGAIDFGLLVDGSVVMVEFVFHALRPREGKSAKLRDNLDYQQRMRMVLGDVSRSVFFSVLIIAVVYLPVITMSGVDGKMFRPMALTVVFALLTSLFFALTFIPAALQLLLRPKHIPARATLLERVLVRSYEPMLGAAQRFRGVVAVAVLALVVAGASLFATRGTELAPQLDEGDLVIQTTRAADIHLDASVSRAGAMERAILSIPEVAHVTSRIGSPAIATDTMGIEQADVFVEVRPRGEWRPGLSKAQLISEVQEAADSVPGGDPAVTQPIQMRFNELLGGSSSDVVVAVVGEDLALMRSLAESVVAAVEPLPGVSDPRIEVPPDVSLLSLRPRWNGAASAGLSGQGVLDAMAALQMGLPAGSTYRGRVEVPIVVKLARTGGSVELAHQQVPLSKGKTAPLSLVAELERDQSPSAVQHRLGQRRLEVAFNVRGRDLGSTVQDAQRAVEKTVELPSGYRLEWGGQYATLQHAYQRLTWVIPSVLALILALLVLSFDRLRPAILILANVPFASIGGIAALSLRGLPLSISAIIGFIAVSGIAVLNGVVLLTQVRKLEDDGLSPAQAAVEAARSRLRPVSMTAMVATLGFVPMMLATGVGAEVQTPLATVVVGGLISSTTLTLLVLPALYPWVAGRRKQG